MKHCEKCSGVRMPKWQRKQLRDKRIAIKALRDLATEALTLAHQLDNCIIPWDAANAAFASILDRHSLRVVVEEESA